MKEAFGGTFTLKLIMVFFVVYVTFMGVALQIAKLYRIKNSVINHLEQTRYVFKDEFSKEYTAYLKNIPYNIPINLSLDSICTDDGKNPSAMYYSDQGVCIERKGSKGSYYYKVSVYYVAEFPFLDHLLVPLTISGETMTIKDYNE